MKSIFRAVFLFSFFCFPVYSDTLNNYLDIYVGADAQLRDMRYKKGFGDNLLKKRHQQGNIYAGIMLNEHFSLEGGYESTLERKSIVTLGEGQHSAGVIVPPIVSPVTFKSKIRIKGPHLNLITFYPWHNLPDFKLLLGLGISSIKATAERETVQFGNPPHKGAIRTMKKRKAVLRIMGGAQYKFNSGMGIRGTISMINTNGVFLKKDDYNPSVYIPMIKPKDSIVYGVGFFYMF